MATNSTIIRNKLPMYTIYEEIANAVTHGLGAAASIVGAVFLLIKAAGNMSLFLPCLAYSVSMLLLFTMSALYHSISNVRAKGVLRICDHSSVFFLIAGTYAPYSLITLKDTPLGLVLFITVWSISILGIVLKIVGLERFKKLSMACCIIAGWSVMLAIVPIVQNLAAGGIVLLFAGGVFYTLGLLFYRKKGTEFMHTIWHLFVLAGAVLHYFSISIYVVI